MRDREHVDEDRRAVQLAPQPGADAVADPVAQAEDRGEPAADHAEAGQQRLVVDHERHGDAGQPGVHEAVAEQRDPVDRDRDEPDQRGLLVDGHQRAREARVARDAPGHREADADGQRDAEQRDDAGRARCEPPAVLGGIRHAASTSPSAWTMIAAAGGEDAARAVRAGQQRRLGERLRVQGRRRERGDGQQAGPRGPAGRGVEQVVRDRSSGGPPGAADDARRRDRAVVHAHHRRGLVAQRMSDVDVARAADADVAAGVDDPLARGADDRSDAVGRVPLAGAAEVEPDAGRPIDGAAPVVDADVAPARRGMRPRRPHRVRRGRPARLAGAAHRAVVAGRLERVEQAGVDEAAAAVGRPERGFDGVAQLARGRHDPARVRVQRAELGPGLEARRAGLERAQLGACAGEQPARSGGGDHDAEPAPERAERLVDALERDRHLQGHHEAAVVTGAGAGAGAGAGDAGAAGAAWAAGAAAAGAPCTGA